MVWASGCAESGPPHSLAQLPMEISNQLILASAGKDKVHHLISSTVYVLSQFEDLLFSQTQPVSYQWVERGHLFGHHILMGVGCMAWVISCHDWCHTQTPVNCSNNTCQSDSCLSIMPRQQFNCLSFFTLRLPKQFRGHMDKQVLIQGQRPKWCLILCHPQSLH